MVSASDASTAQPTVSVVIPAHQAARTLQRAVASALCQTYAPAQIIIIDDASTDGTRSVAEVLANYDSRVEILAAEGIGASAARNTGLTAARGDVTAFLDADDVWFPRKLELQLPLLEAGVAAVGSLVYYVSETGRVLGCNRRRLNRQMATMDLAAGSAMPVALSSVIARTSDLRALGGFDSTFRRANDLEMLSRLMMAGGQLNWPHADPLVAYVIADGTLTATGHREQTLAAELVRLRRSGQHLATSYDEWMGGAAAGALRRGALIAGERYRMAAIAAGHRCWFDVIRHLAVATSKDPVSVIAKLRSHLGRPAESLPSDVLRLFQACQLGTGTFPPALTVEAG